jgi:hypothetical protein
MPPWLLLGLLPEIPTAQALAKTTSVLAYALVFISAILTPGPKRRVPPIVWLYPAVAVLGFIYLPSTVDRTVAMVLQFQFLVLTFAAIFTVRTIVDEESLMRVLVPLAIGAAIALGIPLSALLLNPAEAFAGGWGRFRPYGGNPETFGPVYVLAMPLTLYFAFRTKSPILKSGFAAACATAFGLGLISATRSVLIVMAIASIPMWLPLMRRPGLVLIVACLGAVIVGYLVSQPEEVSYERLTTLETGRVEIAVAYLDIIADRPLFGLLGTSGESAFAAGSIATHPHNVYIERLYIGGLTYFFPFAVLIAYSSWCILRVYFARRRYDIDPVLTATLCTFLLGVYAHGFVDGVIMYPTHSWAWWHVTLAVLVASLASDLRQPALTGVWDPAHAAEYAEDEAVVVDPEDYDWEYLDGHRTAS